MAVAERERVGRRTSAGRGRQAPKERRKKLFVLAAGPLVLLVLAIQVPRTMRMLNPPAEETPTAATTAAAPTETAATAPVPAPAAGVSAVPEGQPPVGQQRTRRAVARFQPKGPFVQQATAGGAVLGVARARPTPDPAPAATGGGRASGYVVVLASIPARGTARRAVSRSVQRARARGVRGVGVLNSSKHSGLRAGYWVVGVTQPSRAAAQRAARLARVSGYPRAYVRRL